MYILELVYNGEIFRVSHYEGEELYESEFKYLVKYEERQRLLMQPTLRL